MLALKALKITMWTIFNLNSTIQQSHKQWSTLIYFLSMLVQDGPGASMTQGFCTSASFLEKQKMKMLYSQDGESPSKMPKSCEGKMKAGRGKEKDTKKQNPKKKASKGHNDAAEREQENKQREKERQVLTERNYLLLENMTALVGGRGGENPFTSNVLSECVDLMPPTPPSIPF